MYDELASGKAIIDLSPSQTLSRAESFLLGQGYVVVHRTLTTLMAERKGSEGPTGQERVPKVVVVIAASKGGKACGNCGPRTCRKDDLRSR